MPHHAEIKLPFELPPPFTAETQWVKGDMINAVSFDRLDLFRLGKDVTGKRLYLTELIGDQLLEVVQQCVAHGVSLTK